MRTRPAKPTPRRSLVAAALTVPLLLIVAACGSSNSSQVASISTGSTLSTASTNATADSSDAELAFAKCMRENGVDMDDPDPNGGFGARGNINPSDPKFQAGWKKCQDLMTSGGGQPDSTFDSSSQQTMLELAKCLRQNGVDMPDPQFDASGKIVMDNSMRQIIGDPKFGSAMKACDRYTGAIPGGAGR